MAAELGEHIEYLLLDADGEKFLQLPLPGLQLTLAELGELDDTLHAEGERHLVRELPGAELPEELDSQIRSSIITRRLPMTGW